MDASNKFWSSLFQTEKKLVFVGGKGGVGKTSISSAISYCLSRNHKTLLVSTDPAHSLTDSLGISEDLSSDNIMSVGNQWFVWELNANAVFQDFKQSHHEEINMLFDTSTYLDNEDVDQLMSLAIPGIDEVMGLKSIMDVYQTGEYDKIIIDMAPTGHALRLLCMPSILDHWVKVLASLRWKYRLVQKTFKGKYSPDDADDFLLDLKRLVSKMKSVLTDSDRCEFLLVCNPQQVVFEETKRLSRELETGNIALRSVIVNRVYPDSLDHFYRHIHLDQMNIIRGIRSYFSEKLILEVPLLSTEVQGEFKVEELAKELISSSNKI